MMQMARVVGAVAVFLAFAPSLLGFMTRKAYKVHTTGAVLITGASTGIGRDACLALARTTELTLFCAVRKDADGEALATASGGKVTPLTLDVTNEGQIQAAAKRIKGCGVPLVGLVNNAGIGTLGAVEMVDLAAVKKTMDVNFFSVVRLTQVLLPMLRESSGRVVTVGSIAGQIPASPGWTGYGASKAAVEMMSDALRQEVAPHGVSVSLLQPGFVKTAIFDKVYSSFTDGGTPEARALYPKVYGDGPDGLIKSGMKKAELTDSTTTPDIVHALTSAYPKTRYKSSNFDGIPIWFAARLLGSLPDRAVDAMNEGTLSGYEAKAAKSK